MKRKILQIVLLSLITVSLIGCGNKKESKTADKKEELSEQYQQELEMSKESADELADLAMEIEAEMGDYNESESVTDTEADVVESGFPFYAPFEELINESFEIVDANFITMTEEELVEAYGAPDRKDGDSLYWDLEDDEYRTNDFVEIYTGYTGKNGYHHRSQHQESGVIYSVRESDGFIKREDAYEIEISSISRYEFYESLGIDITYDMVSDWFSADGGRYEFNNSYEYSTLDYDSLCEKFGSKGFADSLNSKNGIIYVTWYIPEIKQIFQQGFNLKDGSIPSDGTAASPSIYSLIGNEDGEWINTSVLETYRKFYGE